MTVVLDSSPLWLLAQTRSNPVAAACQQWAADLLAAGHRLALPEIADYEVRREFLLRGATAQIRRLDQMDGPFLYLALTRAIMRRAAELWAFARQTGQPTAGDNTIDADVILVAQAESLNDPDTVIATTNVGHLARFFPADLWSNVVP